MSTQIPNAITIAVILIVMLIIVVALIYAITHGAQPQLENLIGAKEGFNP